MEERVQNEERGHFPSSLFLFRLFVSFSALIPPSPSPWIESKPSALILVLKIFALQSSQNKVCFPFGYLLACQTTNLSVLFASSRGTMASGPCPQAARHEAAVIVAMDISTRHRHRY